MLYWTYGEDLFSSSVCCAHCLVRDFVHDDKRNSKPYSITICISENNNNFKLTSHTVTRPQIMHLQLSPGELFLKFLAGNFQFVI